MDWVLLMTGKMSIRNNHILCIKQKKILVNSNLGGLYMLCFSISSYTYALFMWYVFFYVPRKYGVVCR